MSAIGIDFGNDSCYISVARMGGIETIANDYSLRSTPSCVAFSLKNRILGVAAKNQTVTNMTNTIHSFKRLLGRPFSDPFVQTETESLAVLCVPMKKDGIGYKVKFLDKTHIFTPEQVTAMLLTKLKSISETALGIKVIDCVISVPSYFTNNERKALLNAAAIADLKVLRLLNETTATALAYGIYKQDLPVEKPRYIIFVDCGHASLQVSACAFHKGRLQMLASACDVSLGGRDIDNILADYFAEDFKKRYNIDARGNPRAWQRLTSEVEKIKKQMSASATQLPLNIECFMDDKDVTGSMQRSEMEALCEDLFCRCEVTMLKCLEESELRLDEIYAVEIVGGSSRIPAIKNLIEGIFKIPPSTSLNQDEAVSRGCALQCAILSPAIRVREFSVTDLQLYPIKLMSDHLKEDHELEVFSKNHPVPCSKMLTFYSAEPFSIKADYSDNIPYPDPHIGRYLMKGVKPHNDGGNQKVKVKVRVNMSGIWSVVDATLIEQLPHSEQKSEEGATETDATEADSEKRPNFTQEMGDAVTTPADSSCAADKTDAKKRTQFKLVDLPIETHDSVYTLDEINIFHEQECEMVSGDRQEQKRMDARNALEEYVYDLRSKLTSEDELSTFVPDAMREALCSELNATETWLYEDGGDCLRNIYIDRMKALRTRGEPIKNRRSEFDRRTFGLVEMAKLVRRTREVLDMCRQGDECYSHLVPADVNKMAAQVEVSSKWLEETLERLSIVNRNVDSPVASSKVRNEKKILEDVVIPILNKPKPAVEPPPKQEEPTELKVDAGLTVNSEGEIDID